MFDYTVFGKSESAAKNLVSAIVASKRQNTRTAMILGSQLKALHELCRTTGASFDDIAAKECNVSRSTAYAFMAAHKKFGNEKPEILDKIDIGAMFDLVRADVPQEARDDAVKLASAGIIINRPVAAELTLQRGGKPAASQKPWYDMVPQDDKRISRPLVAKIVRAVPVETLDDIVKLLREAVAARYCEAATAPSESAF